MHSNTGKWDNMKQMSEIKTIHNLLLNLLVSKLFQGTWEFPVFIMMNLVWASFFLHLIAGMNLN